METDSEKQTIQLNLFENAYRTQKLDVIQFLLENRNKVNSQFAILDLIMSYFEMIGKFSSGKSRDKSREAFYRGMDLVFNDLMENSDWNQIKNILWKTCRNGIYHMGAPEKSISNQYVGPVVFDYSVDNNIGENLAIDITELYNRVKRHFQIFVDEFKTDTTKYLNFKKVFDKYYVY